MAMTTTPIQETEELKGKVMITHGMITHEPSEKCSICDEVRETFQKDLRSGKVEKLVGKIDPKIKKELLTTPTQETWQEELRDTVRQFIEKIAPRNDSDGEVTEYCNEVTDEMVNCLILDEELLLQRKERETIKRVMEVMKSTPYSTPMDKSISGFIERVEAQVTDNITKLTIKEEK
jgi:hypothetical protein